MRKLFLIPLLLPALALSACQTSSLTEEEKAPVQETTTPFSGEPKEIDLSQSVISFVGESNIIDHEGKFTQYTATVTLDENEPANLEKASIEAELDVATIEVDAAGLQGHLQKADFFDVENHPKITFVSTNIVSKGDNMYDVTGDLTVKGVTQSVTLTDVEITDEYLLAEYDFPRQEFGVGNDNYGDKLLETTVPVNVKLVFQQ